MDNQQIINGNEKIYDTIIIGGGPAGYTAALYASRAGLDVLVLEKMSVGGQMALTDTIDNYPGFDEGIDGFTLAERMQRGAHRFGAVSEYNSVNSVSLEGEIKSLSTDMGQRLARTVIIAGGARPQMLGLPHEEEYTGRGVHYCAHCDGRFYKNRTVAVVGGGNSAVTDALYLSRLCKKVYLIHRRDTLRASRIYHAALEEAENIEILYSHQVKSLKVGERLLGVEISAVGEAEPKALDLDGLFISIGRAPESDMYRGILDLDEKGYIVADESTKTSAPGVFVAGDIRTKPLRQIVTAAADGAVAGEAVEKYISQM